GRLLHPLRGVVREPVRAAAEERRALSGLRMGGRRRRRPAAIHRAGRLGLLESGVLSSVQGLRTDSGRAMDRQAAAGAERNSAFEIILREISPVADMASRLRLERITAGTHAHIEHPVVGTMRRVIRTVAKFLGARFRLFFAGGSVLTELRFRGGTPLIVRGTASGHGSACGETDRRRSGTHPLAGAAFAAESGGKHVLSRSQVCTKVATVSHDSGTT